MEALPRPAPLLFERLPLGFDERLAALLPDSPPVAALLMGRLADLAALDLVALDLVPLDLEPAGLELLDLEPAGLEPVDLEPVDLEPLDREPVALPLADEAAFGRGFADPDLPELGFEGADFVRPDPLDRADAPFEPDEPPRLEPDG